MDTKRNFVTIAKTFVTITKCRLHNLFCDRYITNFYSVQCACTGRNSKVAVNTAGASGATVQPVIHKQRTVDLQTDTVICGC